MRTLRQLGELTGNAALAAAASLLAYMIFTTFTAELGACAIGLGLLGVFTA